MEGNAQRQQDKGSRGTDEAQAVLHEGRKLMELYQIMKMFCAIGFVLFILVLICAWIDGGRR